MKVLKRDNAITLIDDQKFRTIYLDSNETCHDVPQQIISVDHLFAHAIIERIDKLSSITRDQLTYDGRTFGQHAVDLLITKTLFGRNICNIDQSIDAFGKFIDTMTSIDEQLADDICKFIIDHDIKFTHRGELVLYKRVTEDFVDFHTRKISNAKGQTVSIARTLVNNDPTVHCASGLHLATYDFAQSFSATGHIIAAHVNAHDIIVIPKHSEKLRTCKYYVDEVIINDYHRFDYERQFI